MTGSPWKYFVVRTDYTYGEVDSDQKYSESEVAPKKTLEYQCDKPAEKHRSGHKTQQRIQISDWETMFS